MRVTEYSVYVCEDGGREGKGKERRKEKERKKKVEQRM